MWATVNACRGRHYDVAGDGGRTGLLPPLQSSDRSGRCLGRGLDRHLLRAAGRTATGHRASGRRSTAPWCCCADAQRPHPDALRGAGAGRDDPVRAPLLHAGRHARPSARCRGGRPRRGALHRLRDRGPDGDGRAEPDPGPALPVPSVRALAARVSRRISCWTRPGSCSAIRYSAPRSGNG